MQSTLCRLQSSPCPCPLSCWRPPPILTGATVPADTMSTLVYNMMIQIAQYRVPTYLGTYLHMYIHTYILRTPYLGPIFHPRLCLVIRVQPISFRRTSGTREVFESCQRQFPFHTKSAIIPTVYLTLLHIAPALLPDSIPNTTN